MENKELHRLPLTGKVVDVDTEIKITFDSGEILTILGEHGQDCCESVYADTDTIKLYKDELVGKEFKELVIKGIEDMGFMLCFYQDWEKSVKIFIPCYNSQNGYYSSNLELVIKKGDVRTTIDISSFVESDID